MNTAAFAVLTILYIIAVIYLGYLGWKKTRGSEDYMLAGRKLIWPLFSRMAVSISLGSKYPASRAWPRNSLRSMEARCRFALEMTPYFIRIMERPLQNVRMAILMQAVYSTARVTAP